MAMRMRVKRDGVSVKPTEDGGIHVPQGQHTIDFELVPEEGSNAVFGDPPILWANHGSPHITGGPTLGPNGRFLHLSLHNSLRGDEPERFDFSFQFFPESLIVTSDEPDLWEITNPAIINEPPTHP